MRNRVLSLYWRQQRVLSLCLAGAFTVGTANNWAVTAAVCAILALYALLSVLGYLGLLSDPSRPFRRAAIPHAHVDVA